VSEPIDTRTGFLMTALWRGCRLAANFASYYHDARDFASATLCGIPLAGKGMNEGRVTSAMRECPACAIVAAILEGEGQDT
jgi:hypothetical protein